MRPVAFCFLVPLLAFAEPHAYFSSRDNVQGRIRAAIERTQISIDAAVFEMKTPSLIRSLKEAAGRGVAVRLLLSDAEPVASELSFVDTENLEVRYIGGRSRRRGYMHHKFAVFDQAKVVTGSFNWTPSAQHANYENALFEDDDRIVQAYARQFNELWAHSRQDPGAPGFDDAPSKHPRRVRLRLVRKTARTAS